MGLLQSACLALKQAANDSVKAKILTEHDLVKKLTLSAAFLALSDPTRLDRLSQSQAAQITCLFAMSSQLKVTSPKACIEAVCNALLLLVNEYLSHSNACKYFQTWNSYR